MGIPEDRGDKWMVPIWVKKITVPIKISGTVVPIKYFSNLNSTFKIFGVKFSFSSLIP